MTGVDLGDDELTIIISKFLSNFSGDDVQDCFELELMKLRLTQLMKNKVGDIS